MAPIPHGEGFKQKIVGYKCGHCGGIFTPGFAPSQPVIVLQPIAGSKRITRPNKAHEVRQKAGKKVKSDG